MKRLIASGVAIGLIAALGFAATAGADPVTGGKSVFKPEVATFEGFADMSISVGATGAAADKHRGVNFPISGGDVGAGPKGTIEHRGGLVFSRNTAEGGVVKFTQFVVKIGKNKTKLFAKSEHSEVRFLDLDLSDATISGSAGTNLKIKGAAANLAKPGAEVMSQTFDFPFRKGIPMGTMTIKASIG